MKLDLGCGKYKKEGFIGVDFKDYSKLYPPQEFTQHNLIEGIQYKDGELDEIYTSNFLEHLPPEDFKFLMEEMHRVLKPQGKATIIVPHFSGHGAFRPYHKIYFDVNSLMQFTHPKENAEWYSLPLFKIENKKIIFKKRKAYFWNYVIEKVVNLSYYIQNVYEETFLKSLFPAYLIEFQLVKP